MKGAEAVGVCVTVGVSVIVGVSVGVDVAVAVCVAVAVTVGVAVSVARKENASRSGLVNHKINTTIPTATSTMAMPPIKKGRVLWRRFR
jgi:presenilin-like A22 family membrane protease